MTNSEKNRKVAKILGWTPADAYPITSSMEFAIRAMKEYCVKNDYHARLYIWPHSFSVHLYDANRNCLIETLKDSLAVAIVDAIIGSANNE